MIRRWRSTGYRRTAAGTGNDTDALQTDVMRFMSILGLCLMAVFALVQSLPLQNVEPRQDDLERSRLAEEIAARQQRAQMLATELRRLRSLVERASGEKAEKERALLAAEQRLTQVIDRTEQARTEQRRVGRELTRLQRRLDRVQDTLAQLRQTVDDKTQALRTLQRHLQSDVRELDEIRQQAREIRLQQAAEERHRAMRARQQQLDEEQRRQSLLQRSGERREQQPRAREQQARAAPSPVTEEQESRPAKQGFTLRFASDEALQKQIAGGGVSLFAMADKRAWRLSLPNGRPVFSDATFPSWFHEMAASTVPSEYLRQLRVLVAPQARGGIVWGVQLPPATQRDIASLTRGRPGGDLVIAASGRVSLAKE